MSRRWAAATAVLVLALCGCSAEQEPGVDPDTQRPVTTSRTLGPCPPGGPDANTPRAGCLDEEGRVLRP